jgi:hypothetical protein
MGLETGTYIGDLNSANPPSTDPKSQGDDHLRLIKSVLLNTFAGVQGMIYVSGTEAQGATENDYVITVSPAPAAYTSFLFLAFKATHANTGAATIKINSLLAKTIKAIDGSPMEAGDIENGAVVVLWYDGTDFFLISGNDRAARAGDTYTGTHDMTDATLQVADQVVGDNSSKAANTKYVDSNFAKVNSPNFTGTPTAPTAAPGTNTTQLATTAFVVQMAFQAALPAQPGGSATYVLTSTGGVAAWGSGFPDYLIMAQGVI